LACLLASARADALTHRLALLGGGEVWATPDFGGHGLALVQYDLGGLPHEAQLSLSLNTDTLRLALERLPLLNHKLELGAEAKGELLIAGLLTDYYRDGRSDPARGFYASYAAAAAWLKGTLAPHFVELDAGVRRWWFARQGATSPALILPPEAWVLEVRVKYTYWRVRPDSSQWEPQRLFPRIAGVAFGFEVGVDARSQARPWGARDPRLFTPVDLRNQPSTATWLVRQWLRAGSDAAPRVRVRLDEIASFMWGEDDLDRLRIGGVGAYVVPLAGVPWAGLLSGRLAAAEVSLHVRTVGELELGLLADGLFVDDRHRAAPAEASALGGLGAFADARLGRWQIDARIGWTPSVGSSLGGDLGGWTAWLSAGWAWQR
jgi:hypothetical protein